MKSSIYSGKKVLITGGTGFIGRNLAYRLLKEGAEVTALAHSEISLDSIKYLRTELDKEEFKFKTVVGDIREAGLMKLLVADKDYIFDLAALVSHKDKGILPLEDIDVNTRGHITILEALQTKNRIAKVIFSSTRMVYGDDAPNPIQETAPTNPLTYYGISKLATEKYFALFHKRFGIPMTILRIANPYGDSQHFSTGSYSIPGWFMQRAMNGETVVVRSDGKQERDYIYIGDLIEAMLRIASSDKTSGKIYNVGSGVRSTFGEMVHELSQVVKTGKFEYAQNPVSENGSYYFDISRLVEDLKWRPTTTLREGVEKMYAFAKQYPIKK
jgi:nucleoside-diphosphate-sugar epimerase